MSVAFTPMLAIDAMEIVRQPSQAEQLGELRHMTIEEAESLADGGEAWTARRDGRIVACFGLKETFAGRQAVAWAIFASGIGAAHVAITRFARARIAASGLRRIEAIVRTDAEITWAGLVGLSPAHVLEKFGAASERHVLFERIA